MKLLAPAEGNDMVERTDYNVFEISDFTLECGITLRPARVAYKTFGTLNADRSNAIVYPTWYSGRHWENEWLIGEGMALNPEEWFVIVPNMLGNGISSSPSNTPPPFEKARFPPINVRDNVEAQYRLVTEHFGIERLALVTGWSMGAGQTYQWAVSHPEMVLRMLPFCGSSRTSPHNVVFLESVKAALTGDPMFHGGWYEQQPVQGLRNAARVYAGWGFSQAFYWHETYRQLGFASLDDFLVGFWEGFFLDDRDVNDLLCMADTWKHGNVADTPGCDGNLARALGSIRAKSLIMPAEKDLYFPPEDEQWAAQYISDAEVRVIPGVWGHFSGSGDNPADVRFIDSAVGELLATDV